MQRQAMFKWQEQSNIHQEQDRGKSHKTKLEQTFVSDLYGANGFAQATQRLCIYNIVTGKQKKMKQKPTTRK
jgi:hypothetical protein